MASWARPTTYHEHENTTSPFVDQNQTYSSHPSHQVFLRAYEMGADGEPHATGKLITNRDLGADGNLAPPTTLKSVAWPPGRSSRRRRAIISAST